MSVQRILGAACLAAAFGISLAAPALAETTLKFATANPGPNPLNKGFQSWADQVNAEMANASDNDKVKVDVIVGTALAAGGQILDRLDNGLIEIGFELQSYYPGAFPKTSVTGLPGMFESGADGSVALWSLYESGEIADEYEGYKVLGMFVFPNADILTVDPVIEVDGLEGRKLSATSSSRNSTIEGLGATPASIKIHDWYQSLERGLIDGLLQSTSAVPPFSLQEVINHVVQYPLGGNAAVVLMRQEKFDALPVAAQEAIDKHSGEVFSRQLGELGESLAGYGRKLIVDAGGDARPATAAEAELFAKAAQAVSDAWVQEHPDGASLIETYKKMVAEAGK